MRLLLGLFLLLLAHRALSQEPFLQPNDVIALVGGEDMVVASELGYLEALVQQALPNHKLKFRSLAWEGDTVFEQRRDLNYPPLEAQLDKIGATVVIAQFGQMESLAGLERVSGFAAAYDKLLDRLGRGKGRRFLLVEPSEWRGANIPFSPAERTKVLNAYDAAIRKIAENSAGRARFSSANDSIVLFGNAGARDGMHLDASTHAMVARGIAGDLIGASTNTASRIDGSHPNVETLRSAVVAKNRLWHHYSRPQNWAFLAGDRINQPSSRDHKDLSKRWFPAELEQFVPLIEAKEKEIWEVAAKSNR
jgi:hypothetical protein